MIKFYDELYIGIRPTESDAIPLGFATPFNTTAAFKKRKQTVDHWVGPKGTKINFDNVPMIGFQVTDSVSRMTTSNKMFRINDPRGFQLEISADNIIELIKVVTITNGMIKEPLVWGRLGPENYLWPSDSPEYHSHLHPSDYKHKVGDAVLVSTSHTGKMHCVYLGARYVRLLSIDHTGEHRPGLGRAKIGIDHGVDPKPFHLYQQFSISDNKYTQGRVHFRRKPFDKSDYSRYTGTVPSLDLSPWLEFNSNTSHPYRTIAQLHTEKVEPLVCSDDVIKQLVEKYR